jgi:hypothetical protein
MSVRRTAFLWLVLVGALAFGWAGAGEAAPAGPIVLTIKSHRFEPSEIAAPAGQRLMIQVRNLDATPEEFESYDFKVEKIVVSRGTITVLVGPLKPGLYKFFGDYNPDQAKGVLRVGPPSGRK